MTRHKPQPALRLVDSAPQEIYEPHVDKLRGWPLILVWIALGFVPWACAIAAGYVLVMLFRLISGAAE